jgi:hypothetical protein
LKVKDIISSSNALGKGFARRSAKFAEWRYKKDKKSKDIIPTFYGLQERVEKSCAYFRVGISQSEFLIFWVVGFYSKITGVETVKDKAFSESPGTAEEEVAAGIGKPVNVCRLIDI